MDWEKSEKNRVTHVVLCPHELIEKLSALVPLPRRHLVRYSGVLAPSAKMRSGGDFRTRQRPDQGQRKVRK